MNTHNVNIAKAKGPNNWLCSAQQPKMHMKLENWPVSYLTLYHTVQILLTGNGISAD